MDKYRDRVIDELLVLRFQKGNQEAFDLLMHRWQRPLWSYARRLTGSSDDAWDVMQETWMTVLSNIRKLRDPAWFAAWTHRIVRNTCADHVRHTDRQRKLTESMAEEARLEPERTQDNPGDELAEAVERLTPQQRELLTLRYGGNLSVIEIALVVGIPTGTVKRQLHEMRQQLKQMLEGVER